MLIEQRHHHEYLEDCQPFLFNIFVLSHPFHYIFYYLYRHRLKLESQKKDLSFPHLAPQTHIEFYGFAIHLASFIAFFVYLIWAYIPNEALNYLGIYYFPEKHWAITIPAYLLVVLYFVVFINMGYSLYRTPPIDSYYTITDSYANIAESEEDISPVKDSAVNGSMKKASRKQLLSIRELQDIPLYEINKYMHFE